MNHEQLPNFYVVETLSFAKIYLNESKRIAMVQYFENVEVDAVKGQEIIDHIYPYLANGILLGCTDATARGINITEEARKLYRSNKSLNTTIVHAVVVKDLHVRLIANFFSRFENPTVPVKVFTDFKKAITFLEEFEAKKP